MEHRQVKTRFLKIFQVLVCLIGGLLFMLASGVGQVAFAQAEDALEIVVVVDGAGGLRADAREGAALLLTLLPGDSEGTAVLSGDKPETAGKLSRTFKPGRLKRKLERLDRKRADDASNPNAAIKQALEVMSHPFDGRQRILLVCLATPPVVDELLIDALIEREISLFAVTGPEVEWSDAWTEAVHATGGSRVEAESPSDLVGAMVRAFLLGAQPQLLETGTATFQVDAVSSEVTVIARRDLSAARMMLIGPSNRRVNIRRNKSFKDQPDLSVDWVGPMTVLRLKKPEPGLWRLMGVMSQSVVALARSRQRLHMMLPRAKAMQTENLLVAAYMTRDGSIVKLISDEEQIGFFAALVDESGFRVGSAPLMDRGKFPDQIAGDGVFTASIPLDDLRGDYNLWLVARTEMVVRRISDSVHVYPGDWVRVKLPDKPFLPGGSQEVVLDFAPAIPFHRDTQIELAFDGGQPELKPDPVNRLGFLTTLSIQPEDEARQHTLAISKSVTYSPLLVDRQRHTVSVPISEPPRSSAVVVILVGLLIGVNVAGAGAWFWLRRRARLKALEPEEVPEQTEQAEEEAKPKPRRVPKKPPKKRPIPIDEPITETVAMESVTDRISEVAAVHQSEPVKGDVERTDMNHEDLDHDGDPNFASGPAFDSTDQWGQRLEANDIEDAMNAFNEMAGGEAEHTELESDTGGGENEDEFTGLTSKDMDDIFSSVWTDSQIDDDSVPDDLDESEPESDLKGLQAEQEMLSERLSQSSSADETQTSLKSDENAPETASGPKSDSPTASGDDRPGKGENEADEAGGDADADGKNVLNVQDVEDIISRQRKLAGADEDDG